jgi:hypothetical protein
MKPVRMLAAVAAAAAVLLGGAWAGGAFAERRAPGAPGAAVTYPGSRDLVRVGEGLAVAGQPMQLSLFRTGDPATRVARFYADAFRTRGLTPVLSSEAGLAHVAAFDPGDGLQRFVSALRAPDGGTLVMLGSTNPRMPLRFLESGERASFPVPPGSRGFLAFRSADADSSAESAQFVTSLTARALASFYQASLAAEGYTETSDARDEGLLTFLKRGSAISVAMQGLGEPSGAAVFITRTEGAGR